MPSKKDYSYGVIPIKKFDNQWKVFLIHQYSRIGKNSYWILPKGHPEDNESREETALRELREETGMDKVELIKKPQFELRYKFKYKGEDIDKRVIFFVGLIEDEKFILNQEEVVEADWFPLAEAEKRLDYQNAKDMFKKAKTFISSL